MTSFTDLGLIAPLLKVLAAEGYTKPTPIQAQAIPQVLSGRDLLGVAQTGTGKTAAFALPILQKLSARPLKTPTKSCRALILSPTRELASQIQDNIRTYGKFLQLDSTVIFGGVSLSRQVRDCASGIDIIVATPGRLLDLVKQRALFLTDVEMFVLDEADQMLDMGFIHDIRKIVSYLPVHRHNMFFSATMPKEIAELAGRLLTNPAHVAVTPVASTVERIDQKVMFVETASKQVLLNKILEDASIKRALVFSRTKHGADRIVKHLAREGIPADAIHGNKSQNQREKALASFRDGRSRLLIATDIAARGIDVDGVTHVINFDLPNVPESYVHRIGRTARAGADGQAISFCDRDERAYLRDIEKLTRQSVPVVPNPLGPAHEPAAPGPRGPGAPRPAGGLGQKSGRPHGHGGKPQGAGGPRADNTRRPARRPPTNGTRRSASNHG